MPREQGRHRGDPQSVSKLGLAVIGLAFLLCLGLASYAGSTVYNMAFATGPQVGTSLPVHVTPQPSGLFQPHHPVFPAAGPVRTYTVRAGDNLWKIAREQLGSGTHWNTLASLNHLSGPWIIQAGQVLVL